MSHYNKDVPAYQGRPEDEEMEERQETVDMLVD